MEKSNLMKSFIILVAVVVIIESVVIIGRLGQGRGIVLFKKETPAVVAPVYEASMVLSTGNEVWRVGTNRKVDVSLMVMETRAVDAIDLFVKYDPEKVTVNSLTSAELKPTLSKIKPESGLVIANFLVTEAEGVELTANELVKLVTLNVTPKVPGEIQFEIGTGKTDDGQVTMVVENETSREIPFSANGLTINIE